MSVSRSVRWSAFKRNKQGNVIVFMTAVSCTFLLALLLFTLSMSRFLGTNHEQKSSVDAAALAAAKDLSRIVIDDPNFGMIGLSDSAPIGHATLAQDGYYTQVHSINSIFGTIRLDMIIADELNDPVMMQFAKRDYANARIAANNLVGILQASLLPSSGTAVAAAAASSMSAVGGGGGGGSAGGSTNGNFVDAYGNQVFPYDDAVGAYQSNAIRMAGSSQYIEGSMKLTLGSLLGGGPTNTPIPQPSNFANVSGGQSYDGDYMSYVDAPYDSIDFVFAGVGESIKLVDSTKFVTDDGSLPYTIPTIVKAEADTKLLSGGQDIAGRIVHAVACAQPASTADPLPAPGKLTITFIGKHVGKLKTPADLITDPELGSPPATITSPSNGDVPGTGTLAPITWPFPGSPTMGNVYSGGIYDWIRKNRLKPRPDAVLAMMNQPFLTSAGVTTNQAQVYLVLADGSIQQELHTAGLTPPPTLQESQNQLHATAPTSGIDSAGNLTNFNLLVRDWVFKKSGRHRGEPLPADVILDTTILAQAHITGTSLAQQAGETNREIAQGIELGAGGSGAGGPGGGSCGGGGGGSYSGGGSCGSSGGGGSYSGGGSCGGSGGGSYSGGGSCGSGGGSSSAGGSCGGSTGGVVIYFPSSCGNGEFRKTYVHNGLDVDILVEGF